MAKRIVNAFIAGLTPKNKPEKGTETMNKNSYLNGIKEIENFTGLQAVTLMDWRRDFGFPMKRSVCGAVWTADPSEIMAFFRERRLTPKTASTEKLESYHLLKQKADGKGRKHKRTLTGLPEIADFVGINDHLKPYDWMRYYAGCPIRRGKDLQPSCDADKLLQWLAQIELETGEDLTR